MAKGVSIFGSLDELPDAVSEMTGANVTVSQVPFTPVVEPTATKKKGTKAKKEVETVLPDTDGLTVEDADDFLSGIIGDRNIDDMLTEALGGDDDDDIDEAETVDDEPKKKIAAEISDIDATTGDVEWDMDFDSDLLLDMWMGFRTEAHDRAFRQFIPTKKARKVRSLLMRKPNKATEEQSLLEWLDDYCEKAEDNHTVYMDAVPYDEKRVEYAKRCLKHYLPKMTGKKNLPPWVVLSLVFVVPEVVSGMRLARMTSEMPDLDLDLAEIERVLKTA